MAFAAALSEHPLATHATGEVVGQVLESLGADPPDLALVFVTEAHSGALEDIGATIRASLQPEVLVGVTAVSVAGGPREVEERPAVALWAAQLAGGARAVRLTGEPDLGGGTGPTFAGLPDDVDPDRHVLILLTDPFSFPADDFLRHAADAWPGLRVAGGMASAARGPGGNRLLLDDRWHDHGAVGVLVPADDDRLCTVVSQGCRPIGEPYVVTRSEANIVHELGGRPALERLERMVEALGPDERALVQQGLHIGRVIDERSVDFDRGDFLIRAVIGADRESGAVAIGDRAEVGATLQFQVRDALTADDDLRALLAGRHADGALLFTCNGRGVHLFGEPDHDAEILDSVVSGGAVAGMFCAGEIGPVGGHNFLHGFTASMVLFTDSPL